MESISLGNLVRCASWSKQAIKKSVTYSWWGSYLCSWLQISDLSKEHINHVNEGKKILGNYRNIYSVVFAAYSLSKQLFSTISSIQPRRKKPQFPCLTIEGLVNRGVSALTTAKNAATILLFANRQCGLSLVLAGRNFAPALATIRLVNVFFTACSAFSGRVKNLISAREKVAFRNIAEVYSAGNFLLMLSLSIFASSKIFSPFTTLFFNTLASLCDQWLDIGGATPKRNKIQTMQARCRLLNAL